MIPPKKIALSIAEWIRLQGRQLSTAGVNCLKAKVILPRHLFYCQPLVEYSTVSLSIATHSKVGYPHYCTTKTAASQPTAADQTGSRLKRLARQMSAIVTSPQLQPVAPTRSLNHATGKQTTALINLIRYHGKPRYLTIKRSLGITTTIDQLSRVEASRLIQDLVRGTK